MAWTFDRTFVHVNCVKNFLLRLQSSIWEDISRASTFQDYYIWTIFTRKMFWFTVGLYVRFWVEADLKWLHIYLESSRFSPSFHCRSINDHIQCLYQLSPINKIYLKTGSRPILWSPSAFTLYSTVDLESVWVNCHFIQWFVCVYHW